MRKTSHPLVVLWISLALPALACSILSPDQDIVSTPLPVRD